jgi:hypothetical protein
MGSFGTRLTEMHAWLDENCGADDWAMTPGGVVNDAVAIHFLDARGIRGPVVRRLGGRDHASEHSVCARIGPP